MRQLGQKPKRKFPILKILILSFLLTVLTIVAVKILNLEKIVFKGPKTVVQLITRSGLKSYHGRVDVLLLGIGGANHQGPDLTDTMILASVDKSGKDVVLISIPRDLWVPSVKAKINAAYAFGQEKDSKGLELIKKTVSDLLGLPVHYALRLDFDGFVKAVDLVDGLDIDVEKSFIDSKYPIAGREDDTCGFEVSSQIINGIPTTSVKHEDGSTTVVTEENDPFSCRYETLTFNQGPTHLDGTTALKFVRSRHGTNDEGSDFARSSRQQRVILAFRQKVLSSKTFLDPKTVIDLAKTFGQSIDTDIGEDELPYFAKLIAEIDPQKIRKLVLDSDQDNSPLKVGNPIDYGGQFVLVPANGNWTDLGEYIQGMVFDLDEK